MYFVPQANTSIVIEFLLVRSVDHITGATGQTPIVTLSKNGGAYAPAAGAVFEIGNGRYGLRPDPRDTDTVGPLMLHAVAPLCDPEDRDFFVTANMAAISAALSPSSTSTQSLTGRLIVTGALRLLGVLQPNEVPGADDLTTGMYSLNELIDTWGAEMLTIPVVSQAAYPLTAGVSAYTIGPGGTWSQSWPNRIEGAQVVWTSAGIVYRIPVQVVGINGWTMIAQQGLQAPWPWVVYYSRTFPLGTIKVWPVPNGSQTVSLEVNTPTALAQFATADTAYALQPAYARALRFNLAVALSPEYPGRPVDPIIANIADTSLRALKVMNVRMADLDTSLSASLFKSRTGNYWIYTDGPV